MNLAEHLLVAEIVPEPLYQYSVAVASLRLCVTFFLSNRRC